MSHACFLPSVLTTCKAPSCFSSHVLLTRTARYVLKGCLWYSYNCFVTLQSSTFPSTFYILEIQFSQNCLHWVVLITPGLNTIESFQDMIHKACFSLKMLGSVPVLKCQRDRVISEFCAGYNVSSHFSQQGLCTSHKSCNPVRSPEPNAWVRCSISINPSGQQAASSFCFNYISLLVFHET